MLLMYPCSGIRSDTFGICVPIYSGVPYIAPNNVTVGYQMLIDWDADGDFSEPEEDVTAYLRQDAITFSRGKDSERGVAKVGSLNFKLDNVSGLFTPTIHPTTILPRRLVQFASTTGGASNLFTGYLEDIIPHPDEKEQYTYFTTMDGLDYLSRCKVSYTHDGSIGADVVINAVLDLAAWPSYARRIDPGLYALEYPGWTEVSVKQILEDIATSQGKWVYIDENGYLVFDSGAGIHPAIIMALPTDSMSKLSYTLNPKDVYNEIKKDIKWVVPGAYETIFDSGYDYNQIVPQNGTLTLHISWEKDIWVNSIAPSAQTPDSVSGPYTDYYWLAGHYTMVKNKNGVDITWTGASDRDITIIRLWMQGTPYTWAKETIIASDSTSQLAYQKRTLLVGGCNISKTNTQTLTTSLLASSKDPHPAIQMELTNSDTDHLALILGLTIGSRIGITGTRLGISSTYTVIAMQHEISNRGLTHKAVYRLA